MGKMIELQEFWNLVQNQIGNKIIVTADSFIRYLEDNDWFGMEPQIVHHKSTELVLVPEDQAKNIVIKAGNFLTRLTLREDERLAYLHKTLSAIYPDTAKSIREYAKTKGLSTYLEMLILDFLISFQRKEVHLLTTNELEELLYVFSNEMTKDCCIVFATYINWLKDNRLTKYNKIAVMKNENRGSNTKYAYDFETTNKLYYYLFVDAAIEENDYYRMIADNEKSAVALLFLSLHLVCSIRDEDLKYLPHPRLKAAPEDVLESIRNKTLSAVDAISAVNKITREIELLQPTPTKLNRFSHIPYLKLFIPESAKVHFGYLFCAAEAHFQLIPRKKDKTYIYPITTYEEFERYLCDDIADIFWDVDYSARAFNKTHMQLVQYINDADLFGNESDSPQPIGYMLAAFARGHKGSYNDFANMTARYLRDHAVTGQSVEFIVKELTERGVCSFVVSELLEVCYGKDFRRLTMTEQTAVIKEFGLDPQEAESAVIAYEDALIGAADILKTIVQAPEEIREETINKILKRIALGTAVSKQKNILCLMTALGKDCYYPDRKQCLGCSYEILTKSTIYTIACEYKKQINLMNDAPSEILKNKYKQILNTVIIPAIREILLCAQLNNGKEYAQELSEIMKGIMNDDEY